ncbi:MAG: SRPBCC family protein [Proteobacteria bacterium]|nr:SRPBCC family protein [Pseudomonadota bacterium]
MFKRIAIVLVVIIAGVLIAAATRPDSFRVERSIRVSAPAEKIFHYVNDFHQWGVWSPWEKLDPTMKRSFTGPESGNGAVYEWQGNGKVGQGRMQITDAAAPGRVVIKLDFIKPFEAHNRAIFNLQSAGGDTEVVWAMEGPSPYLSKLMGLFFNMDKLIGGDFERGLANLKAVSEK